jgi:DNA-binding transcriptional LysR family regulator
MQADLNRLQVFYHIFSSLSITVAAAELGITPSAVSQQLKKLEQETKTVLFTRLHKRLVPTAQGNRLFALVDPIIKGLKSGLTLIAEERSEPNGLLRVGAPMEFGSVYLPHVFSTFRARYDKVTFSLELGRPSTLLPMVNSGDLDFAFVDTFPTKEQHYSDFRNLSVQPVIEEQVVLACSRKFFDLSLKQTPSYQELIASSFISQEQDGRALYNWFLHHFGKSPSRLNIVLTVSNHRAVVSARLKPGGLRGTLALEYSG